MSPKSKRTQGLESPTGVGRARIRRVTTASGSESTKHPPDLGMADSGQCLPLDEEGCKKATVEGRDLKWMGGQQPQSHGGRKRKFACLEGLAATREDFHSEPQQSLLLWWLLSFTESWCHLCTMHGTLVRLHGLMMCSVDNEGWGRVLGGGAGCLVNMRSSEFLTQR